MDSDYSKLKNLIVLVADDEPDLRDLLVFDLHDFGIKTLEASNYKESTKIFINNNIDFVLSDFNMPGGSAIKFINEIQTVKPTFTNVAFLSGESNQEKRPALEKKGITGFFIKPISTQIIIDFMMIKLFP